jgi:hypothetical protein
MSIRFRGCCLIAFRSIASGYALLEDWGYETGYGVTPSF